jgi:hypothetical protein
MSPTTVDGKKVMPPGLYVSATLRTLSKHHVIAEHGSRHTFFFIVLKKLKFFV